MCYQRHGSGLWHGSRLAANVFRTALKKHPAAGRGYGAPECGRTWMTSPWPNRYSAGSGRGTGQILRHGKGKPGKDRTKTPDHQNRHPRSRSGSQE
eukprot:1243443-Heterocapsa_arctica.AAC.1